MKFNKLQLSTQIVVSYVVVMAIACLFGGILTILLEGPHLVTTVDTLSDVMEETELENLAVRLDVLLASSTDLFAQFQGDAEYQHTYATDLFSGALPVVGFYPNYAVIDVNSNPPPDLSSDGISSSYSSYYIDSGANSAYLSNSSILDNSHMPIWESNPSFSAGLYMGFEDGLMRNFPYQNVKDKYQNNAYTCVHSGTTVTGYDPRCRLWYDMAIDDLSYPMIYTPPYIDASTGNVMITMAKAVTYPDGTLIGVVGADIFLDDLASSILSAVILNEGYTYMCDADKNLIVHPDLSYSDDATTVTSLEFDDSSEASAFNTILDDKVLLGLTGQQEFTKNGDTWYVTYGPVDNTQYYLLMVVPRSDVIEPATSLKGITDAAMVTLIIIVVVLLTFIICVGTYFAKHVANKITAPVVVLSRVLKDIANQELDDKNDVAEETYEFAEVNELQSKIHNLFLAVKFSTEAYFKSDFKVALECLKEVEEMFDLIGQKRALGVIYNNKGNILRKANGKQDGYLSALTSLKQSVDNVSDFIAYIEKNLKESQGDGEHEMAARREATQQLMLLQGTLGSRLSNYADCLREAGKFEDAFVAVETAYELCSSSDNTMGMIQALSNKGLVYIDMENFVMAAQTFETALDSAKNNFNLDKSEKGLTSLQNCTMNLGMYYYKHAQHELTNGRPKDNDELKKVDVTTATAETQRLMECALNQFYYTLGMSSRVPKTVQATCVITLVEIYTHYYGEVGAVATDTLQKMFPTINTAGTSGLDINFLIDVSGSMAGTRIKSCRDTLLNIVRDKMRNGDILSTSVFSNKYKTLIPRLTLNETNRNEVQSHIHSLPNVVGGTTYFYNSLLRLAGEVNAAVPDRENWIVALTDGEDNEHNTRPQAVIDFCQANKVKMIIISVGVSDTNVLRVLRSLASEEKYFIKSSDSPENITDALMTGFTMAASGNVMMESL